MISIDAAGLSLAGGRAIVGGGGAYADGNQAAEEIKQPTVSIILLLGAVLGFASGLTGIGGGVFLSPISAYFWLVLYAPECGVAAGFILLNSVAGLAGYLVSDQSLAYGHRLVVDRCVCWLPAGC